MKFKYNGQNDTFCLELLAYGIMKKDEYLKKGMIVEVPNDNQGLIDCLNANGLFEKVNESKKVKKENKE